MKKLTLLIAALVLSFTAQAKVINAVPEGDIAYYLSIAESGDIIELADGVYDEEAILTFSVNGLVVKAAEGANPVIQTVGKWMAMNVEAATTFEGIVFDAEAGTDGDNQYGFNISANTTFNNCKFQDYTKYAVTLLAGTTTFDNCVFDGAGVTPSAIVIDGTIAECSIENSEFKNYKDYDISVEDNTTIATLTIDQCVFDGTVESVNTTKAALFTKGIVTSCTIEDSEFKNFAECAITVDKWYGGRYDALTINNCLIHDCTQSAIYLPYAIDSNEKQTCSDFKLTNSTIYNIGNGSAYAAIDIKENSSIPTEQQALIDHLTIYNIQTSSSEGAITIANASKTTISNCIIASPEQKWIDSYNVPAGATIQNCLVHNQHLDDVWTSIITNADPMFVDAANADFMLYAESPAVGAGTDGSNLGDPRWGVKAGIQPGEGKLKDAVEAAQPGATIILGDETYEVSSSIEFNKEGLTIVAAEGTSPIIKLTGEWTSLELSASTTFDGITFDGNNITKYPVTSTGTNASTYIFTNCEFKNYVTYAISNPYSGGTYAESVVIDNCLFHDGGAAVCFNKRGYNGNAACNSFKMTNTTIYNVTCSEWVGIIHIASNEEATDAQNEVIIDHITMYNFTPNELGGITSRFSENVSITNSIFANPTTNANQYAFRVYGASEVKNTLYHNARIEGTPTNPINADPLFVNAAENNFDLYANSPAVGAGTDGSTLGDPRWGVSAKVLGKRINVTPEQASSLQWIIQNSKSDLKSGDTLVLADGLYEVAYSITFNKPDICIMADENANPVIKLTQEGTVLNIQTTTSFDGITFDGGNVAQYLIATTGVNPGTLTINNCEFRNWTYWALSNQFEETASIDSVIIDNTLFHDGAEAAIYFSQNAPEGKHACNYFKMTNSTIYNVKSTKYAGIVHVSSNAEATGMQNKVIIDHVTMYNLDGADLGIIAVRKSSDLTISNTIIANPAAGERASYVYGGVAEKVIYFNVSQDGDLTYTNCLTDDPLFVDAANNDFMLQANSPAIGKATDGSNLGDPRWGVAEPELITLTTGNNDAVIEANIGKTVNVKIERSFTANDGYYTLCVPFNMDPSVIGKAYSLGTITEHVAGEGINIILVEEEYMLSAGVPYLVLPKANMSELVVENVTIQSDIASGQNVTNKEETVKIFFEGFYSAPGRTTNGTTEYYVGNDGYLYKGEVEIRGLCGLFTITDANNNPLNVRARVVTREEVETGLDNNQLPNTNIQKVLENGQLIIIRDGVKYNVQGQVIK